MRLGYGRVWVAVRVRVRVRVRIRVRVSWVEVEVKGDFWGLDSEWDRVWV